MSDEIVITKKPNNIKNSIEPRVLFLYPNIQQCAMPPYSIALFNALLKNEGFDEIIIVKGYLQNKINFKEVTYFVNDEFRDTNMVESLFCAESVLEGDLIITYSDLIYDSSLLKKVVKSNCDMGVVIDLDFEEYWEARLKENYDKDMESLVIENDLIKSLGSPNPNKSEVNGRYVGILKFSSLGVDTLKAKYKKYKSENRKSKFADREFRKWHMTDFLQEMIDDGSKIQPITTSRGWLEFDTDEDYETYNNWLREGSISRFIDIE